ncbi:hypothetical protein GCM10020219_077890 [Nonomuraea dietziae]
MALTMSSLRSPSIVADSAAFRRPVRDDDELGVVAMALLADGLDGDVVLGEERRHLRQNTSLSATSSETWQRVTVSPIGWTASEA